MDAILGLLGPPTGGDAAASGGSILTEEDRSMAVSAEGSSSYPTDDDDDGDGDDLELGLGLTGGGYGGNGGGGGGFLKLKRGGCGWGGYARILTAKANCCCSCSSSSSSAASGSKRAADDPVSPPNNTSAVIGWPPIRKAHRIATLSGGHTKSPGRNKEFRPSADGNKPDSFSDEKNEKSYRSVKVNMDGTPIGRKVDLNAHHSYDTLARMLEDMFRGRRSSAIGTGLSNLLHETSEYMLTYEDRDGDCMLVGDVPWPMFLSSVKRLRIMRNPKTEKLETGFQEKNTRQKTEAV